MGGINERKSLRFQAKVSDRNAALDRAAAQDALERGRTEEMRQGRRTRALIGQQRAAAAANGVAVDFGSMADLQADTRNLGYEDAQTLRKNSMREAQGYEISAWNRKADASAKRAAGGAAMWSAAFDAAGTLLKAGAGFATSGTPQSGGRGASGGKSYSPSSNYGGNTNGSSIIGFF